ncbi:MAG: YihY/virulence factor BrkB family protein [Bacteriovoracaceae bacterium]
MNEQNHDEIPQIPVKESRLKLLNPVHFTNRILEKGSDLYDGVGFAIFRRFVNACMHGHYVYEKNSGGLYVGSATFYGLLSIIPVLSCATFILGLIQGNMEQAHVQLFREFKSMIPATSHELLNQVGSLTESHLKNTPLTFLNLALLAWTTKGFFATLVEGLLKVTGTKERGGAFMANFRALGTVVALGGVLMASLEFGENGFLTNLLIEQFPKDTYAKEIFSSLARWQIFTMMTNALTVTLLYKWLLKSPLFACLEGTVAFITGFLALKSFYWIYLHYNEASTTALFGGFAPMVVSILWGYFAITAFFIGACVASLPHQKMLIAKIPNVPNSWDEAA